jgi:hypothetical protein
MSGKRKFLGDKQIEELVINPVKVILKSFGQEQ